MLFLLLAYRISSQTNYFIQCPHFSPKLFKLTICTPKAFFLIVYNIVFLRRGQIESGLIYQMDTYPIYHCSIILQRPHGHPAFYLNLPLVLERYKET